jgi:hypothetical protein
MVYNERLLLNPHGDTPWFFNVDTQHRLMYASCEDTNWLSQQFTGISGVTAFEACLTDDSTPCLVCLEQQGRLSCIVYKDNQWHYYPTAAIPQNTVPEFLNIFCVNELLYVYSGFRRADGKLYTFCASRANDMWSTFKPDSDLYDKKARVLSTLPYKEGIALALQQTNEHGETTLSFMYMTQTTFSPLFDSFACVQPIQSLALFYHTSTNELSAIWAEGNRCRFTQSGRLIHDRTLSIRPDQLFCDISGKFHVGCDQTVYHLNRDLSLGTIVNNETDIPIRQIFSRNGSVQSYMGIDSRVCCEPSEPLSGVASVAAPKLAPRPILTEKKQTTKGMNVMVDSSSLEDRIVSLENNYNRLEKVSAALSEQVKHFRSALLQTEDYMQQRDKALYRLESALGRPLTSKPSNGTASKNKSSTNAFSTPFEDTASVPIPKPPAKDGENLYSGMDGLYIIRNKPTNKQ